MSDLPDQPIHLLAPRLTRTSHTACGLPGNDIRLHVITRLDGQGITCEGCRAWFSKLVLLDGQAEGQEVSDE